MSPETIKTFRLSRGWNQQQLAEELGVDQATVSRIENGSEPRETVKRLLARLMAEAPATPQETPAPVKAA